MEKEGQTIAIEIKVSQNIASNMLIGWKHWGKNKTETPRIIIYNGEKSEQMEELQ